MLACVCTVYHFVQFNFDSQISKTRGRPAKQIQYYHAYRLQPKGHTEDDGFAVHCCCLLGTWGHCRAILRRTTSRRQRLCLCTSWRKWGAGGGRCSAMKQCELDARRARAPGHSRIADADSTTRNYSPLAFYSWGRWAPAGKGDHWIRSRDR
jgi:hypothetical protein